jgi:predicted DsbA family dithiol-disulfide isomerase
LAAASRPEATVGLDMAEFRMCIESGRHDAGIQRDIADAGAAGLTGSPSLVLGKASKEGIEGIKIVGAVPYSVFKAKIRELLSKP